MDKLVRQSRVAQLKTQRPMDLFKLNLYLTAWGSILATICFLYVRDYGLLMTLSACIVILLTLVANAAIYMPLFTIRLAGYATNIVFHIVLLISGAISTLGLVLDVGLSPRLGAKATLGILTVFYLLWYYNPMIRVIKTDRELQSLRADEAAEKTSTADDIEVAPNWDEKKPQRREARQDEGDLIP
ncbi:MAG TPA: hypothetical protein VL860_13315 [Planctomycetota bacterium]|nr:hypothetical protein [Planctomycetota bacterium]